MDGQKLLAKNVIPESSRPENRNKRLLLLTKTDFTATTDGGTMRVAAIVEALQDAGFEVDWVSIRRHRDVIKLSHPDRIFQTLRAIFLVLMETLRVGSLSVLRWYSPRAIAEIMELRSKDYSLSIIEYSQLFPYEIIMPDPVVVDLHNIEAELLENYAASTPIAWKRFTARYEARRMRAIENQILKSARAVSVVSSRDRELLLQHAQEGAASNRVVLASNGVADEGFNVDYERNKTIVFVAHLGWQPNIDAAIWLVSKVWPLLTDSLPGYKLQLVGRNPAPEVLSLATDVIEVHANVPSAVDFVARASLATAPLLAAGGTRLKILEGLACGTPVVATSLGALGLESLIAPGVLAIGDTPESFADQVLEMLDRTTDSTLPRKAAEPYRWRRVLDPLVQRIASLASSTEETPRN